MLEDKIQDLAPSVGPIAVRPRLYRADNAEATFRLWGSIGRWSALLAADGIAFGIAGLLALHLTHRMAGLLHSPVPSLSFLVDFGLPSSGIISYLACCGRYTSRTPFWTDVRGVLSAGLFAIGMEIALAVLIGDISVRLIVICTILLAVVCAIVVNYLAKVLFCAVGIFQSAAVVIGDEARISDINATFAADRSLGYVIAGTVDASAFGAGTRPLRLSTLVERFNAQCLVIAVDDVYLQRLLIERALRERVPFLTIVQPGFYCQITRMLGQDAMLLSHATGLFRPFARLVKATFDVVAASILLMLASPFLMIIAMMVRSDGGVVLFRHRRVGTAGRHFWCLKFRTMVSDAQQVLDSVLASDPIRAAEWRSTQKLRDDPRVTKIGRFLRRTSLDELPQLINVLRLEMSLVGPRPIVDNEIEFYGENIAHYFATRPGLTGLWQVSGRSDTSYARRVQLDVWYVNNWTIWYDIAVLLKTIPVLIHRRGAR